MTDKPEFITDEKLKEMNSNTKVLGYYVDRGYDVVFLEMELKDFGDGETKVITLGFGKPMIDWMLETLDTWEDTKPPDIV